VCHKKSEPCKLAITRQMCEMTSPAQPQGSVPYTFDSGKTRKARCGGWLFAVCALLPACARSQQSDAPEDQTPPRHILWVIPNFRTSPVLKDYKPITPGAKFKIAAEDTFDRGTVALAAVFAAQGQMSNSNRSFGQGVEGFMHYGVTAYADFAIGNYMTEAIYPTILHQDPRYFRRGSGRALSRLGYAIGQIFWTHTDSGGHQFNYSEIVGNATAVAISMSYYPENRNASDAISKLGTQIALDTAVNVIKEFWTSSGHKKSRRHADTH